MQMGSSDSSNNSTSSGTTSSFDAWNSHQLTLLFHAFHIKTKWEFALAWFAVVFATCFMVFLSTVRHLFECMLKRLLEEEELKKKIKENQEDVEVVEDSSISMTKTNITSTAISSSSPSIPIATFASLFLSEYPSGWIFLKLCLALICGCEYGLALMLMLVAMTFNPSLFLALGCGYALGHYLFANMIFDLTLQRSHTWMYQTSTKIIHWLKTHVFSDHIVLLIGMLSFPIAMMTTYGLIENVCWDYAHGYKQAFEGPFAGSFPVDWCDLETNISFKKALEVSLAVFYAWVFVLTCILCLSKVNKSLYLFLHRESISFKWGITNGDLILFVAIVSLLFFNGIYHYYNYKHLIDDSNLFLYWINMKPLHQKSIRRPWYFATQVTGRLCDVSLGLLVLPISKNSIIQLFLGISYKNALTFHKYIGWFFAIVSAIHVGVYIKSAAVDDSQSISTHLFNLHDASMDSMYAPGSDQNSWGIGNWMTCMATIGTLIIGFPLIFSLSWIREQAYNLFYYSHLIMHFGLIFLWLHASSNFYYMLPSIGLYACDICIRLCQCFLYDHIVEVQPLSTLCLTKYKIQIDPSRITSYTSFTPGQFIRIRFPMIKSLEWHPMSIASMNDSGVMTLYFSDGDKLGDWVALVNNQAINDMSVTIDGIYGNKLLACSKEFSADIIICYVGGSGVTVGLSLLDWLKRNPKTHIKEIYIIWSNRFEDIITKEELLQLDLLFDHSLNNTTTFPMIHIICHHTNSKLLTSENTQTTKDCEHGSTLITELTSMLLMNKYGRIDFLLSMNEIIESMNKKYPNNTWNKKLGIISCGSNSFLDGLRLSMSQFEAIPSNQQYTLALSEERFCF